MESRLLVSQAVDRHVSKCVREAHRYLEWTLMTLLLLALHIRTASRRVGAMMFVSAHKVDIVSGTRQPKVPSHKTTVWCLCLAARF
jgi:hypothetical protein